MSNSWTPRTIYWCPPKISSTKQLESALEEIKLKPDNIIRFHIHEEDGPCAGLLAYDPRVPNRECWEYRPESDDEPLGWARSENA